MELCYLNLQIINEETVAGELLSCVPAQLFLHQTPLKCLAQIALLSKVFYHVLHFDILFDIFNYIFLTRLQTVFCLSQIIFVFIQ